MDDRKLFERKQVPVNPPEFKSTAKPKRPRKSSFLLPSKDMKNES